MGDSLILEKLFSMSSFYGIACFSVFASGPNLDTTITSDNIFRSSSTDAIIFNCKQLIMDASFDLEDFFGRSRISPTIKDVRELSSPIFVLQYFATIKGFQKVQREVSYFPYVVRENEKPS